MFLYDLYWPITGYSAIQSVAREYYLLTVNLTAFNCLDDVYLVRKHLETKFTNCSFLKDYDALSCRFNSIPWR